MIKYMKNILGIKAEQVLIWSLTFIRYRNSELMELYLYSPSTTSLSGKGEIHFFSEKLIFGCRNDEIIQWMFRSSDLITCVDR